VAAFEARVMAKGRVMGEEEEEGDKGEGEQAERGAI